MYIYNHIYIYHNNQWNKKTEFESDEGGVDEKENIKGRNDRFIL